MYTRTTLEPGTSLAEVSLLRSEQVPFVWQEVLNIIEVYGEEFLTVFSEEELFSLLSKGIVDMWVGRRREVFDGFALCGWELHSRTKYYHVLYIMGSNLHLYLNEGLQKIEKYAFLLGAAELVVEGRKGWLRLLGRRKYVQRTIRLRKNLIKAWGH